MSLGRRSLLALLVASSVAIFGTCRGAARRSTRVVLITLDTLRQDCLLDDAAQAPRMPRLRSWAEKGRVFSQCYSATSSTQPTHASLFTGLHPWQHGVPRNGTRLPSGHLTMAERLREHGFRTSAVVASFPLHSRFGFDQGFEVYLDEFTQHGPGLWEKEDVPDARFRSSAEVVVARALELLESADDPRQFLWFHFFDAHAPYGGTERDGEKLYVPQLLNRIRSGEAAGPILDRARRLYDRDVLFLDAALGRLLDRIHADSEQVESHVVIVSDHGESFGEGGSVGHGKRLTPEQIRVPCLVLSPRVEPGVSSEPVATVDITTTLLSLADVPPLATAGRDLTAERVQPATIAGMRRTFDSPFEEFRVDGTVHLHRGVRFYVLDHGEVLTGDSRQVTRGDSTEPMNDPERLSSTRELFAGFERALAAQPVDGLVDPETARALRALGYVR